MKLENIKSKAKLAGLVALVGATVACSHIRGPDIGDYHQAYDHKMDRIGTSTENMPYVVGPTIYLNK